MFRHFFTRDKLNFAVFPNKVERVYCLWDHEQGINQVAWKCIILWLVYYKTNYSLAGRGARGVVGLALPAFPRRNAMGPGDEAKWKTGKKENRPFPSDLLLLFQNESWCKTFHMEMYFTCKFIFIQIKLIFIRTVSRRNSFWNRGKSSHSNFYESNAQFTQIKLPS